MQNHIHATSNLSWSACIVQPLVILLRMFSRETKPNHNAPGQPTVAVAVAAVFSVFPGMWTSEKIRLGGNANLKSANQRLVAGVNPFCVCWIRGQEVKYINLNP